MGILSSVRAGLTDPKLFAMEAKKVYTHKLLNTPYSYVMDRDWDILVILDGCRYDLFNETQELDGDLDGTLNPTISPASCTRQWLQESFPTEYPDTVYVSANPQTQIHGVEDRFFRSIRVWDECWSDEHNTARPDEVIPRAIDKSQKYQNKRIIVHLVQPHYPFIGDLGQKIDHRGFHEKARAGKPVEAESGKTIWDRLKNGQVTKKIVWEAYKENLELALSNVKTLIEELDGKIIITSDHGNALGEWGIYGHPCGLYHSSLVKVPWFETEFEERREIIAEKIASTTDSNDNRIKERLADLGYVDLESDDQ